jgi:hypothetical protein
MKKKIALIACNNGYGHIRRVLLLIQSLTKYNDVELTIFAPIDSVVQLCKKMNVNIPNVVDFNTNTNAVNWLNGSCNKWHETLPSLEMYDVVVSDNLIEILYIRPDAWLLGSFFWHEGIKRFPKKYKKKSKDILRKYNPKMISSKMFTSPYLRDYTELYEVGLFVNNPQKGRENSIPKDLLIAAGLGGEVANSIRKFINSLVQIEDKFFDKLWIDPDLLPKQAPEWMVPATFSEEMYKNISAAIIRPGVGTITDALSYGARICPFYEDNNEMKNNSHALFSYGLAKDTSSIECAWKDALSYISSESERNIHSINVKNIDLNGCNRASELIYFE